MTEVREAVREGSLPEAVDTHNEAESAQRARSIPPASLASLKTVTQRATALLDRPGSLVHAQPPTFRQARDRHHECAAHFQAGALRWPRLAWGYLHLLVIKPALNLAEWVTESPARLAVTAAIIGVVWIWS